jgi:hypothetical protein
LGGSKRRKAMMPTNEGRIAIFARPRKLPTGEDRLWTGINRLFIFLSQSIMENVSALLENHDKPNDAVLPSPIDP